MGKKGWQPTDIDESRGVGEKLSLYRKVLKKKPLKFMTSIEKGA